MQPKKRVANFMVKVIMPEGMTVEQMRIYVRDALCKWRNNEKDPSSPLFSMNDNQFSVR